MVIVDEEWKRDLKKAAQDQAFKAILANDSGSDDGSGDRDGGSDRPSNHNMLTAKIKDLESALARERELVKSLQQSNMMLQNALPDLLKKTCRQEIMQSCAEQELKFVKQLPSQSTPSSSRSSPSPLSCLRPITPITQKTDHRPKAVLDISGVNTDDYEITGSSRSPSPPCSDSQADTDISVKMVDDSKHEVEGQECQNAAPSLSDLANPVQLAEVNNAKTAKKMTGILVCILFERSVLAASSVTGKSKEGRPALDPHKVQLIIAHVRKNFPDCTVSNLKAAMAQKCKDERIAREARRNKAEKIE